MNFIIKLIAYLLLIMLSAGCSTISGYPNTKKSELPPVSDSVFLLSDNDYQSMTNKDTRNNVIHAKLRDIDLSYSVFEAELYRENILTDLTTDITLLALTGGTVLTGSKSEKELLAAISAFILGSKSAFDKRALFESTMSVFVQKMRADRAIIRNDILRGKAEDFDKYTRESAAIDIARYFYAGTIPSALTGLSKLAVDEQTAANEEKKTIIETQFTADAARKCLLDFWKPGGAINATHQSDITSWKANSAHKNVPFGIFMNGGSAAKARVDAVNYLIENGKISGCSL